VNLEAPVRLRELEAPERAASTRQFMTTIEVESDLSVSSGSREMNTRLGLVIRPPSLT
jgi:hypothetical protein